MSRKCNGRKSNGDACPNWAMKGGMVCRSHGGGAPQTMAKAAVRDAVMNWFPDDTSEDPGSVLLKMVTVAYRRASDYAAELARVRDQYDSLHDALVGVEIVVDAEGKPHEAGEYVRALVELEGKERERAVAFSKTAIAAGLATRQVELAEQQGNLIADVLRRVLGDPRLGLSAEQRQLAPDVIRSQLEAVS